MVAIEENIDPKDELDSGGVPKPVSPRAAQIDDVITESTASSVVTDLSSTNEEIRSVGSAESGNKEGNSKVKDNGSNVSEKKYCTF